MCVRHVSVNFNSVWHLLPLLLVVSTSLILNHHSITSFMCVFVYVYMCVCIVAVLLTVSVSVFGAMVSHLDEIFIEGYDHLPYLSWSYWLAVAATLVAWLTAVCFFFVCRLKCSLYTV